MPVHEIKYRAWTGELSNQALSPLIIAKYSIFATWSKKLATVLLGLGSLTLIVLIFAMYMLNTPLLAMAFLSEEINPNVLSPQRAFFTFFWFQFYVSIIVLALCVPVLIPPEIRHNGLMIIFSRPISKATYIFGKSLGIFTFVSYLLIIQFAILTIAMFVIFPLDHVFFEEFTSTTIPLLVGAGLNGVLIAVTLCLVALACAAFSQSQRQAMILFVAIVFGSSIFGHIAHGFVKFEIFEMIGLLDLKSASANILLGNPESTFNSFYLFACFLFWWLISLGFLFFRVQPFKLYKE